MNITKEKKGELTATVKVEVSKEDYSDEVRKVLKDYQKKANMPGFRPGKVPYGMIKKMYGKAVVADEINKILSESLSNYIRDNELNILGQPLPSKENIPELEFSEEKDYAFYFDMGLAPEVALSLSDRIKVDYYSITVDKKSIDDHISNLRKRLGDTENPETAGENDILRGDISPLGKEDTEEGESSSKKTTIALEMIKSKKEREKFTGRKVGDRVVFNPLTATDNKVETAHMLGIQGENISDEINDHQFIVEEIIRIKPAELNHDFFHRLYPDHSVHSIDELRERVSKEIEASYERESSNKFMNDAVEKLIQEADLNLPDDFLKRWMLENSENDLTEDQVEKEYEDYSKALQWQLIMKKIVKDHNILVKEDEVKDFIRSYFTSQMHIHEESDESNQYLNRLVDSVMQNQEEVSKIYDQLYDIKVKELLKSTLKLKNKKVSYDDFIKLVSKSK